MRPISEQVVLICGASRGIGRAVAKRFSSRGAKLALHYFQSSEAADTLASDCRLKGSDVYLVRADVTERASVKAMIQRVIDRWHTIDSVIYSAGIGKEGLFQDMTEADYDRVMDVHVRGAFYVLQEVFPYMLRQKAGRVVLMSSVWGSSGAAGEALYSAAKGAVNSLTKALAKEWAPSGITVNAIAPGAVDTDMLSWMDEKDCSVTKSGIPLGRFASPGEIAYWAEQLCEPESRYMTGQILHVNGGWFTP